MGYVTDVAYTRGFTKELAPAWLDFVAALNGVDAPRSGRPFTWCELGSGQGVTAALLATLHREGSFHAIDALAAHGEHAQGLARAVGLKNLFVHTAFFSEARKLDLPRFDYIVAHGVYSWVDARAQADLRAFVGERLKPGGLFYVSYNAMPGWACDLPFQHLVLRLGATAPGDSIDRFQAAIEEVAALTATPTLALKLSPMAVSGYDALKGRLPAAYFAHEYLASEWRPCYVDEVRAAMAAVGLRPLGSATLVDNFDSYVLRAAEREALQRIADADTRELVRDYMVGKRFRRDVFVREPHAISADVQKHALLSMGYDLMGPDEDVRYAMTTPAGEVTFDNPTTRAIVEHLRHGPSRLIDVPLPESLREGVLANAMALCAAQLIRPVEPQAAFAGAFNRVVRERLARPDALEHLALPHGTGLKVGADVIAGVEANDDAKAMQRFLRRYGARLWAER